MSLGARLKCALPVRGGSIPQSIPDREWPPATPMQNRVQRPPSGRHGARRACTRRACRHLKAGDAAGPQDPPRARHRSAELGSWGAPKRSAIRHGADHMTVAHHHLGFARDRRHSPRLDATLVGRSMQVAWPGTLNAVQTAATDRPRRRRAASEAGRIANRLAACRTGHQRRYGDGNYNEHGRRMMEQGVTSSMQGACFSAGMSRMCEIPLESCRGWFLHC